MLTSALFQWKSATFVISRNNDTDCISTLIESLRVALINMVVILMMSAKLTPLGLLKIKVMTSFLPWHHPQHFITWLKLYCRCGQKCDKRVETKCHKVFGANSLFCRSYKEKAGGGGGWGGVFLIPWRKSACFSRKQNLHFLNLLFSFKNTNKTDVSIYWRLGESFIWQKRLCDTRVIFKLVYQT